MWIGNQRTDTRQCQAGKSLKTSLLCRVLLVLMALPDAGLLSQYDEQQGRQSPWHEESKKQEKPLFKYSFKAGDGAKLVEN